ncbi:MAG: OmpA family protein [Acidobacteriota bacterium]|nr:OmpA family protein [Acidobacteriota bacterium]
MRRHTVLIAVLAAAVLAGQGCVTKKLFRKNVEENDTRVGTVESSVEANQRRIGDLKTETDQKISDLEGETAKARQAGEQAMGRADTAYEVAERAERGRLLWSVTLTDDSVRFTFGEASIPSEAAAVLDDLASNIKDYGKAVYIEIEGHTDATGDEAWNVSLGEKRAMAVRNYLASHGNIPLHAMNTISMGESQPVADNSTSAGRAQNRRVVVRVLE